MSGGAVLQMSGLLRIGGRFAIEEVYPGFMFSRPEQLDAYRRVVEEMDDLPPVEVIGWFHEPRPELGGKTPAAWLAESGDPGRVLALVHRWRTTPLVTVGRVHSREADTGTNPKEE
jgi:hypothetical protein